MKKIVLFFLFFGAFFTAYSYENTYAVIVGVADYKNFDESDGDLNYTVNDAQKFYDFLLSEYGGSVPKENIVMLLDGQATRDNIIAKSKELFANVKSKDRVFFYFSGHGSSDCFMPYDVTRTGNNLLYFSDVKEIFRCAKCGTKLLFADACFSGTMKDSIKKNNKVTSDDNKNNVNIAVMMSCANDETSLELKSLGQGIFTYYLIKGLGGEANRDNNEYITIQELFYFIRNNVTEKSAEYNNKQTPELFGKFDLRLIVAKVDLELMKQKQLDEEKKTDITIMVAVYVAVTIVVVLLIAIIKRNNKRKHENI